MLWQTWTASTPTFSSIPGRECKSSPASPTKKKRTSYDVRFLFSRGKEFENSVKLVLDKWECACYYTVALRRTTKYGRVVELVDSLDSGSSVHCGRAGSSPASPTKEKHRNRKISMLFLAFLDCFDTRKFIFSSVASLMKLLRSAAFLKGAFLTSVHFQV